MNNSKNKNYSRSKWRHKIRRRNSSLCDCCTIPMRNIIRQLGGQTILVKTFGNSIFEPLLPQPILNDFLAVFQSGQILSIYQVLYLSVDEAVIQDLVLEPIRKDDGECSCCEDPITRYFSQNIGSIFIFVLINGESTIGEVLRVGEGIIIIENNEGATVIISACSMDSFRPV